MDLTLQIFGMVITALITWLVAWRYYVKASRDLAAEANELRRLNVLMLRGLESAGLAEFSRDAEGCIKGMVIKGFGHLQAGSSKVGGSGTVTPADKQK